MSEIQRILSTYLFVSDIDASLGFYNALGMRVEKVSEAFGRAFVGGETALEMGTVDLTASYDPGYVSPAKISKGTINFELESRTAVDKKYAEMIASGHSGHLEPIDALWQSRFAILLDPDGNQVGLHSPRSLDGDRQREQGGA
jgi:catechol 2,3-dioxygenase-like lactoylglutathione lyase family enzyme